MTEDDAKTKWCPFARCQGGYAYGNPTQNRVLDKEHDEDGAITKATVTWTADAICIGSACMAWRTVDDGMRKPIRVHPSVLADNWQGWARREGDQPDGNGYILIDPPSHQARDGYCGLAGAPQ